jgi:hypothetical protein
MYRSSFDPEPNSGKYRGEDCLVHKHGHINSKDMSNSSPYLVNNIQNNKERHHQERKRKKRLLPG